MTLLLPDGSEREIAAEIRTPFADPFSNTEYVTLYETTEEGQGGRHQVVVSGQSASRFVVAVGATEEFFTPTERAVDRPTSFPGIAAPLQEWYSTPADGSTQAGLDDGAGEVDTELVEEALEELAETDAEPTDEELALADGGAETGGSSTTWIAPAAVGVAALLGAGLYLGRRRQAA